MARMATTYTHDQLEALKVAAAESNRKRAHLNTHPSLDSPVQRLFVAMHPDTYVRPHRHPQSNKWEMMMVIEGSLDVFLFDDAGAITSRIRMGGMHTRALEIPANTWHSFVVTSATSAVMLEIKEGPYIPATPQDFATWSPEEGSADVPAFVDSLRQCSDPEVTLSE